MIRPLFIILVLAAAVPSASAQPVQVGDLEAKLGHAEGAERARVLLDLVRATQRDEPSTSVRYGREALTLLQRFPDLPLEAEVWLEKGRAHFWLSEFDSVVIHGQRTIELAVATDNLRLRADGLNLMGVGYSHIGDHARELDLYLRALAIREQIGDRKGVGDVLNNIGVLHGELGNHQESLDFHLRALAVRQELNDERGVADGLNNIGAQHLLLRNHVVAIDFFQRALLAREKLGDRRGIAETLNNIGVAYTEQRDYARGIRYYERALAIREDIGDRAGTAATLVNMGALHERLGLYDKALAATRRSLAISRELGELDLVREGFETLSTIYEAQGQYDEALQAYKQFKATHDSLFNIESHQVLSELQTRYQTQEQQQQIAGLQQEKEIQRLWLGILVGGIVLLSIIASLISNRSRLRRRALHALEQVHHAEAEKARLRTEAAEALASYLKVENERKTQELEAARSLQLSMLPASLPELPKASLAAFMQTAAEVGGDYYDYHLDEDGTLTLAIGDATGHGTQAGTIVTATKSLFNLLARERDLSEILRQTSFSIRQMNLRSLYMAMALARLRDDELELAGAGIPPALIFRAATGDVEEIPLKGMPLGSFADFPYHTVRARLHEGDAVLLMSDGFPELLDRDGDMLGYERATREMAQVGMRSAEEIMAHFKNIVAEWGDGNCCRDDITFLVLKMKGQPSSHSRNNGAPEKASRALFASLS